jgi:hypothetical protein
VSLFHVSQSVMATDAQIVDRFVQLKTIASGMGTMAGYAAATLDNTMGVVSYTLFTGIFLVSMAADAKACISLRPELELVTITMGIMADRAVTGTDRPMDMLLIPEFDFIGVALKTDLVDPAREHGDFGIAGSFPVATHTVDIRSRAVQPLILIEEIAMTGKTGRRVVCILFQAIHVQTGIFRKLVAVTEGTLLWDQRLSMEKKVLWIFKVDLEQGSYRLIANFQFLFSWIDHKGIVPLFKRKGIVGVVNRIFFIEAQGIYDLVFTCPVLGCGYPQTGPFILVAEF